MSVIPLVQNILSSFETLKHDMDTIGQKIKDIHSEQDDLLHEVELTRFNACEGYNLARELKILRHKRREYKDQEEQLDMLRGFMNKHKWIVNDLKPLIKLLEDKQDYQLHHRTYTPKIRKNFKLVRLQQDKLTAK